MFDLVMHLYRQALFSQRTFGPYTREKRGEGCVDHIEKECVEVRTNLTAGKKDVKEWVDIMLLSFDGAMSDGHTPEEICAAIDAVQSRNEARTWPDWRTQKPGKAIEHVRSVDMERGTGPDDWEASARVRGGNK